MNREMLIQTIVDHIKSIKVKSQVCIMEVCGTHTQAVTRSGLHNLISPQVKLLSGPGCPVCVTHESYIDSAINLLKEKNVVIATFGDLMRVKGSRESLMAQKTEGMDVEIVYSPIDAIKLAVEDSSRDVVFLAVGFETTAPLVARTIQVAEELKLSNLYFMVSLKRMEPVLRMILNKPKRRLDGIICPGHVAAVKGADYFKFIIDAYKVPAVIAGFEDLDVLGAVLGLLLQITGRAPKKLDNLYKRCVSPYGNEVACRLMEDVFTVEDGWWRGIGVISNSGLSINKRYEKYDALKRFNIKKPPEALKKSACQCGEVLLGVIAPYECKLFGKFCNPHNPAGPCMVSSEGSCAAYYRVLSTKTSPLVDRIFEI